MIRFGQKEIQVEVFAVSRWLCLFAIRMDNKIPTFDHGHVAKKESNPDLQRLFEILLDDYREKL